MPVMTKIAPHTRLGGAKSAVNARVVEIARGYLADTHEAHEVDMISRTVEKLVVDYALAHHEKWMLACAYDDADKFRQIARGIAWETAIICGLRDKTADVVHFNPPIADRGVERSEPTFMGLSCERCDEKFRRRDEVVEVIDNRSKEHLIVHATSCFLKSDRIALEVTKF